MLVSVPLFMYDPREACLLGTFQTRAEHLNESQQQKDIRIGFGHVINLNLPLTPTKYGAFSISYQLALFDPEFEILSAFSASAAESCQQSSIID